MTTNTDPVRALIEKWRGTHGSGFTSQGEFQAHLSTLRTCADELESVPAQQPAGVGEAKETDLWRCTVCGRVGTVGRCCGEETREPLGLADMTFSVEDDTLAALAAQQQGGAE